MHNKNIWINRNYVVFLREVLSKRHFAVREQAERCHWIRLKSVLMKLGIAKMAWTSLFVLVEVQSWAKYCFSFFASIFSGLLSLCLCPTICELAFFTPSFSFLFVLAHQFFVFKLAISSELAGTVKSVQVKGDRYGKPVHKWNTFDTLSKPTTEVRIFFQNADRLLYQVRVAVDTDINGTLWQQEIDRVFLQVTQCKGDEKCIHPKC